MGMFAVGRTRGTALLAAILGAVLALAGCGAAEPAPVDTTPSTANAAAFPVTIDTAYGQVTVNEKPERIVVVPTNSYIELLGILGEKPLAWGGSDDIKSLLEWAPWMEGIVDDEPDPSLYNTADFAPSPEAVAALQPDLILTDIWNTDEGMYEQLSAIAPTYVGIETDTQTSWQVHLAALAQLTGHDPAIVDQTEQELGEIYAAAKDRLRGLQGATFQVPVYANNVFWPTAFPNDIITSIGLVPGDDQEGQKDAAGNPPQFSQENIELLTADVVFFAATYDDGDDARKKLYDGLRSDPRLAELPAAKNGAIVYLTASEWSAVNGGTPASYRWWLERIVPQLEASTLNQRGS